MIVGGVPMLFSSGGSAVDPYYANVSLLLHGEGANNSTTFTDSGPLGLSPSVVGGNVKISTTYALFGDASIAFDGAGDYLRYAANTAFSMGAGDFTIECWWRPNSIGSDQNFMYYGLPTALNGSHVSFVLQQQSTNKIRFFVFNNLSLGVDLYSTSLAVANTPMRIGVSRNGSNWKLFINGVVEASATSAQSLNYQAAFIFQMGIYQASPTFYANGYLDEVRITKGVARFTANYDLATEAFPDA